MRLLQSVRQDAEFYRRLWTTLIQGETWTGRFVNRRKDGTEYEEDATISPVRDGEGKTISSVGVKRDITRESRLEMEMRQAQKMEAIGTLAGGVAHDFNNILAVIKLQSEVTAETEVLSDNARSDLREINAAADRGANLARQLLRFSRKQVMQRRVVDLNNVIADLAKMLR